MKFNLLFIVLLLLLSCNRGDHVWNEESNRVAMEVRKTLLESFEEVNAVAPIAELKYIDTSSLFSWQPPGYDAPIDFDSVKSILIQNTSACSKSFVSWDSLQIFPQSKNKAKYIGKITMVRNMDTIRLLEEGHLIKREDGWKLVSGKTVISPQ